LKESQMMDIHHPWTRYEVARLRDEERLLRARAAMQVREVRKADVTEVGGTAQASSWLDRLRRRDAVTEQPAIRARPV
jgi:hypothetical protein